MAPTDIHLKLDRIKGESTSARHKDEIVVERWAWGAANPAPAATGGGGGAGRATFSDLTFTHRAERVSPALWEACATGRHVRDAVLSAACGRTDARDPITSGLST